MKAIVQEKYGEPDVLELRDTDKPVVEYDEVLVRVHAASVHPDVWHVLRGLPYVLRLMGAGLLKPKNGVPGTDVAGHVESVGKNVTWFQPGDEVFGESVRGHQWHNGGAYAEYVSVPEDALALKPANVTFEQAAAVPTSGLIALQGLRDGGRVRPGQRILINGAGGGVGTLAVQLAKAYGAEVTGVDSTEKVDMVRSLGADHVVDYTREDFTKGEQRYDLIIDSAVSRSLSECRRALTPEGTYVLFGDSGGKWVGGFSRALQTLLLALFVRQKMRPFTAKPNGEDLQFLKELIDSGKVTPVIDRTYPLSEAPEALRYLEAGHPQGKVVITM